jgi:hypothetical protein
MQSIIDRLAEIYVLIDERLDQRPEEARQILSGVVDSGSAVGMLLFILHL